LIEIWPRLLRWFSWLETNSQGVLPDKFESSQQILELKIQFFFREIL
jgi:hypothetical protein